MAPLCFLLVMTLYALLLQIGSFLGQGNYVLMLMALVILGAAVLVALTAVKVLRETGFELVSNGSVKP
jgi:carbon starvation protein